MFGRVPATEECGIGGAVADAQKVLLKPMLLVHRRLGVEAHRVAVLYRGGIYGGLLPRLK